MSVAGCMVAPMPDTSTLHVNDLVAAELRAAAGRRNLSSAQIARNAGAPSMFVLRRLNGETTVSVADLVMIARAMGAEPLDVLAQVLMTLDPAEPAEATGS